MADKFIINVNSIDHDGNVELAPLTIYVNPPKHDSSRFGSGWTSSFSIKIPPHIWEGLAGREIPPRDRRQSGKDTTVYGKTAREFPKTITWQTVREIVHSWQTLLGDYSFALKLDKAYYEKVIFYELGSKCNPFTVALAKDAELGSTSQASFNYAIGYLLELPETTDSWGTTHQNAYRYDANKRIVGHYQNEKFYAMKHVAWTEERQQFFDRLQLAFDILRERVDRFEEQISEKTIDKLAASQTLLLNE